MPDAAENERATAHEARSAAMASDAEHRRWNGAAWVSGSEHASESSEEEEEWDALVGTDRQKAVSIAHICRERGTDTPTATVVVVEKRAAEPAVTVEIVARTGNTPLCHRPPPRRRASRGRRVP